MCNIEYLSFKQVDPKDLMAVANEDSLRTHLIEHPYFDDTSIQAWMADKIATDAMQGCRVRAVSIDGTVVGWCGIQPDDSGFELAVVISQKSWGSGILIFKTLIHWAKELGHKEVLFHLLDSRREYKALYKLATNVHKTELMGRHFTTYHFSVDELCS